MLSASTVYEQGHKKQCILGSYKITGEIFARILEEVCNAPSDGGFAATRENVGHIHPASAISTSSSLENLENGAHTGTLDGGLPCTDNGKGNLGHAPELVNTSNVTDSQTRLKRARNGIDINRATSQNTCSDLLLIKQVKSHPLPVSSSVGNAHTLRTAQQVYPTPPPDSPFVDQPTVPIANTLPGPPSAGTYLSHGYITQPYGEKSLFLPPFQNGAIASSNAKVEAKRVRLSSTSKKGPLASGGKSAHGDGPYFCRLPGCRTPEMAFSFWNTLMRHQRYSKEHSNERFFCPFCDGRSFSRKDRLNGHIKAKHPDTA